MEEKNNCKKCCYTKWIAMIALIISVFIAGLLTGKCMANCSQMKKKCKTYKSCDYSKSYKDCSIDAYSSSTCKKKEICPTNGPSCKY